MSNGKVILEKADYDAMRDKIDSLGHENELLKDENVTNICVRFNNESVHSFGFRDVYHHIPSGKINKSLHQSLESVFGSYTDILNELEKFKTENEKLKNENETLKDIKNAINHFNSLNGGSNE